MKAEIEKTCEILRNGGVILYPTDTVWGIGCDATNQKAIQRIYGIKERDDKKSMLVLMDNEVRLSAYISDIPEIAFELIEVSENPLTIIYPGARNLPENIIADDGSIGIRITSDPFCQKLIRRLGRPIVSTSANISGEPSPAVFPDISELIINRVDHVVQWRQDDLKRSKPSSIIKIDSRGYIEIIRK